MKLVLENFDIWINGWSVIDKTYSGTDSLFQDTYSVSIDESRLSMLVEHWVEKLEKSVRKQYNYSDFKIQEDVKTRILEKLKRFVERTLENLADDSIGSRWEFSAEMSLKGENIVLALDKRLHVRGWEMIREDTLEVRVKKEEKRTYNYAVVDTLGKEHEFSNIADGEEVQVEFDNHNFIRFKDGEVEDVVHFISVKKHTDKVVVCVLADET